MDRDALWRRRALAPEIILEAHDVMELGCRDLDEPARLERLVAMDPAGPDVGPLARAELALLYLARIVLERQEQPALEDVDPLVLDLVMLERQALARLDHEELADVAVRPGPDHLVAPRLLDPPWEIGRGRGWRWRA